MKILIITQFYDPEPIFKGQLFAKSLVEQGHEVEVITGFPNYPGGKVYEDFKIKWIQKEEIDGIKINRVPLYPSHNNSAIKRILNYASFALSSTLFGIFAAKKADVIYVYHPPLTVGVAGALVGLLRRTPFVFDVQDLWPDTLRVTGMIKNHKILSFVEKMANWVYRRAKHVVVLCPGFKTALQQRGVPEDKVSIIYNWCDKSKLTADGEAGKLLPAGFNVVFAGNMGPGQNLSACIEAAEILQKEALGINFVFVGSGISLQELKKQTALKQLGNVHFIPRMPMEKVGGVLGAADALLVHLKRDPLYKITLPSKTQAYMAIGKPILMAVEGDGAEIVELSKAGISCTPESATSIADAAKRLYCLSESERKAMGENAKCFYEKELSLEVGTQRFLALFKQLTEQK